MNPSETFITIVLIVLATQLTRWGPFLLFRNTKELPGFIKYLSTVLPLAVLAILVVYCLKDLSFNQPKILVANALSIALIFFLHLWKRKVLLSILGGTVCYMILLQLLV